MFRLSCQVFIIKSCQIFMSTCQKMVGVGKKLGILIKEVCAIKFNRYRAWLEGGGV